ncbi:MAG: hypothetical protein KF832_06015 [Caldilineaceae bacterium]|nr:hypothetical protein [Caldilineaceae bacterium]
MIKNRFRKGPEGWCSYDYHASIVADGVNYFVLTTWSREGGVNNGSYIWTDHRRWSADTPEKPLSILPLLFYRSWVDADPVDLRGCEVSFYLRGDGLRLDGALCYFWVVGPGTRWHYTAQPLTITEGAWSAAPQQIVLQDDEAYWHRSWAANPATAPSLSATLGNTVSYGFSFVGFSSEVSGRFSLAEFAIGRP